MLAGIWGSGNGTTAYNENVGAMQITGVGSRRVVQAGAGICMVLALIGELRLAQCCKQPGSDNDCCSDCSAVPVLLVVPSTTTSKECRRQLQYEPCLTCHAPQHPAPSTCVCTDAALPLTLQASLAACLPPCLAPWCLASSVSCLASSPLWA